MQARSAHLTHSPFAVVELDSDVVFVEGREFKVQKLQSASFKDQEMVAFKRKRPVKSQGAYLKTLPALTRQLFRLGKKVSTMPMGAAERVVAADLRKRMVDAFREKSGVTYINFRIKKVHASELEPTAEMIHAEMTKLRELMRIVESQTFS